MPDQPHNRTRVYGIDFSGARDAGKRISIASGIIEGDALRIGECFQAQDLPGSTRGREECLGALQAFIAGEKRSALGLDFPFGLPWPLVAGKRSWEHFVLSFPGDYPTADEFRDRCRQAGGGHELKRTTDRQSKTPFSAYNLRLYRQTYYGIRDVLYPLVRDRSASVLPMQVAAHGLPWVLEICPASTLKSEHIPAQYYKRKSDEGREVRRYILSQIEARGTLSVPEPNLRARILDDPGGDALDSVIAAFATFRAIREPAFPAIENSQVYALEGYVYV